jgi:predicted dithiol-disulfide oxidoreductase (DUF899 family)
MHVVNKNVNRWSAPQEIFDTLWLYSPRPGLWMTPKGAVMPESPEIVAIQKKITELKEELTRLRRLREPEPVKNYTLKAAGGEPVTLVDLFDGHRDMLLIHNMGRKCPYCTLWADGFNGLADHLMDRAAFVLSTPDEPRVAREFAESRAWRFPVVSHAGTPMAKDLGYEPRPGNHMPGVSALRLNQDRAIERTGSDFFGPGDDYCSAWRLFDLLEDGANEWSPKYSYDISPIKVNF